MSTTDNGTADIGHQAVLADGEVVRVMGHAEVLDVVTDPERYSSATSRFLQVPNGLDGAAHRLFRRALDAYFTPARMAALEPAVRDVARRVVSELPRGEAVDFTRDLGTRYAVQVMLAWLGWPDELEEELVEWVFENAAATRSRELERTTAAAEHFDHIIDRVIAPRLERREDEPRDVTDELLRERVDGRLLTRPELVSVLRNWTGGDLGSMALCVGVIGHQLAVSPDVEADVRSRRNDPDGLAAALDELLRIDDPFVSNRRKATKDTEIAGCPVHAGQRVLVDWTNANRDPRVFQDPDRYDPEQHAQLNLVYGAGPHVCPGRPLATLELRVLFEELLDATTDLSHDPGSPGVRAQRPLGGWSSSPVVLTWGGAA
ncbi:cytochrome P450 [Tessaracoccus rhinocerotis]|nr:cytochrome P450 [Tessaracoccus rhinocerotis]